MTGQRLLAVVAGGAAVWLLLGLAIRALARAVIGW